VRTCAVAFAVSAVVLLSPRPLTAATVDEDLVPGGAVLSTVFPSSEVETYRVTARAGAVLRVDLRPSGKGDFSPTLGAVLSDGTTAAIPLPRGKGRSKARLAFPVDGTLTLTVGSAGGAGDYRLRTKLRLPGAKAPRCPNEDHRDASDPGALLGDYAATLAVPGVGPLPAFLTGQVSFDGMGRVRSALNDRGLATDAASPFGFTFTTSPVEGGTGSYFTDGTRAAVSLDTGGAAPVESEFTVASGGSVLYTGLDAGAAALGLLLRRDGSPSAADLAGNWFYSSFVTGTGGSGSVEAGVLSLNASGAVSGIGASTPLSLDGGGAPVPGTQTPVLRLGTFSAAEDGTVTFTTNANLFGPQETWTTTLLFRADILAGGGPAESPASEARLLLRQGTGLTDASVAGDYLHFGAVLGTDAALRTGILAFDGAGGFSGTETVAPLAGGTPQTGVVTTGTYSVNSQGVATFVIDGGVAGTGIAGPDAAYLFTFSLGTGGLGIDFLLDLGN